MRKTKKGNFDFILLALLLLSILGLLHTLNMLLFT